MQVGVNGYAAYDSRNEQETPEGGDSGCERCHRSKQELYHFNRMALSVYTELGMM